MLMKKYKRIGIRCGEKAFEGYIKSDLASASDETVYAILSLPFIERPSKFRLFMRKGLEGLIRAIMLVVLFYAFTLIYGCLKLGY